jgi:preprotein translocase subunit YajC
VFLAQEEASEGGSLFFPLLMIVGLFAIFYFLLIRPNRRRRQLVEKLQSQLSVGDEVMTSSGLYGTVAEMDEKTVILETSEGVYSRYARGAIMEVVSSAEGGTEPDPTSDSVIERDTKD